MRRALCHDRAVALALLLAFPAGPGCSLLFVEGPPPESAHAMTVECTTRRAYPIADTVLAMIAGIRIGYAFDASDRDYQVLGVKSSRKADIATSAALLALFGTSAVIGYNRVGACRKAKAADRGDALRRHGEDRLRRMRLLQQQQQEEPAAEPPAAAPPKDEPPIEAPRTEDGGLE